MGLGIDEDGENESEDNVEETQRKKRDKIR